MEIRIGAFSFQKEGEPPRLAMPPLIFLKQHNAYYIGDTQEKGDLSHL